jgi:tRNA G10  N-methylase Trm11
MNNGKRLKKESKGIEREIYIGPKEYPIKIQTKTFKGRKYLDIRKWFLERKSNELLPTKKGISLSEYQFEDIIAIISQEKDKISKWFKEKISEEEIVETLIQQAGIRRKIAEEAKEFKTGTKKLNENRFFKVEYENGKTQLTINENHQLAKEIEKINKSDKKGKKKIIEFLLISFNQTMQMFDVDEKIKFSDFEELLIHNWSIILKNYLRKFND